MAEKLPFAAELVDPTDDMALLMTWADIAIAAAGNTSWELAFMGVPSVLVAVAPNQQPNLKALTGFGAALNGGVGPINAPALETALEQLLNDVALRNTVRTAARATVDGRGSWRVVDVMRSREVGDER